MLTGFRFWANTLAQTFQEQKKDMGAGLRLVTVCQSRHTQAEMKAQL